jgi:hypothetical protein
MLGARKIGQLLVAAFQGEADAGIIRAPHKMAPSINHIEMVLGVVALALKDQALLEAGRLCVSPPGEVR